MLAVVEDRVGLVEHPLDLRARQARHALDRRQRQCEDLVAGADDQRLRDRERERQANREIGALARQRVDAQRTAESLDLIRDHVHADAAARGLRELRRGREARLENEVVDGVVGHRGTRVEQAALDALVADRGRIEAGTVVGDVHDHLRALSMQADRDLAERRLAHGLAPLRQLDAVHDGVAHHVLERRQHLLEHLPVEFATGALDGQLGLLAGLVRGLAHEARKARYVPLERHHARAHEAALQLRRHARLLGQQRVRLARHRL